MDDKLKAAADLEYIKKMISDRKTLVLDNGIGSIVWGLIIIIGLSYTYFDVISPKNLRNDYVWFALVAAGWIYTLFSWRANSRKQRVKTLTGKLIGMVWLGTGIALTILGLVGTLTGAISGVYVSPVMSVVLGTAFFISSRIFNDSTGTALSTLWWIGAIVMFVYPGLYVLLLMAAMMLFLQVVPGIMLFRKYKGENS